MIKAIIFDLDGTLIQTEVLKATSYATAINSLTNGTIPEQEVIDKFGKYVGLSRSEVLDGLFNEFSDALFKQVAVKDSQVVKDLIINKRISIYRALLSDSGLLSKYFCPFTLNLLHQAYEKKLRLVLATMSHLQETTRIIAIMGIHDKFERILTRDDVEYGKPDPEIYLKANFLLGLNAEECLVIEDSVNGIKAGIKAGMHVFAVTNEVTQESVHTSKILDSRFIVDDLENLTTTVFRFLESTP